MRVAYKWMQQALGITFSFIKVVQIGVKHLKFKMKKIYVLS